MKNETLYNKTVGILVDAYMNDTLAHGDFCCCAFGNMVAANCGIKVTRLNKHLTGIEKWYSAVYSTGSGTVNPNVYSNEEALKEIASTGYTPEQCVAIEAAFESTRHSIGTEDEAMFNGLMSVIDVLDQIHENTDTNLTTTTKSRFNKVAAV